MSVAGFSAHGRRDGLVAVPDDPRAGDDEILFDFGRRRRGLRQTIKIDLARVGDGGRVAQGRRWRRGGDVLRRLRRRFDRGGWPAGGRPRRRTRAAPRQGLWPLSIERGVMQTLPGNSAGTSRAYGLRRAGDGFPWGRDKHFRGGLARPPRPRPLHRERAIRRTSCMRHETVDSRDLEISAASAWMSLLARDQDDGVAIDRLEPADRALDPHPVVQVSAVGPAGQSGEHAQLLGETLERAPAAVMVAAAVEHDAAQPRREQGLAAKAVELFDQSAADVLRDIVGVGARSGHLPGEPVDAVVVPAEQFAEAPPRSPRSAQRTPPRTVRIALARRHPPAPIDCRQPSESGRSSARS